MCTWMSEQILSGIAYGGSYGRLNNRPQRDRTPNLWNLQMTLYLAKWNFGDLTRLRILRCEFILDYLGGHKHPYKRES